MSDLEEDYPDGTAPEILAADPTIRLRLSHIEKPLPGWFLDDVTHVRLAGDTSHYSVTLLHSGKSADTVTAVGESFDLAFMDACAAAAIFDNKRSTNSD